MLCPVRGNTIVAHCVSGGKAIVIKYRAPEGRHKHPKHSNIILCNAKNSIKRETGVSRSRASPNWTDWVKWPFLEIAIQCIVVCKSVSTICDLKILFGTICGVWKRVETTVRKLQEMWQSTVPRWRGIKLEVLYGDRSFLLPLSHGEGQSGGNS